jgi:branched-chain amino acid transport system permease protein
MNFVNLMHGSLYMMGAYFAAAAYGASGSFLLAALVAVLGTLVLGLLVERVALAGLYERDHLDQVLGTFGLILFFNEAARFIWGITPAYMDTPSALSGTVSLLGMQYPAYRLAIIVVGLLVAGGLFLLIHRTNFGMMIRASASNARVASALGVNAKMLNTMVFGLGAALAGLAGVMAGPVISVQSGMGEPVLILAMVVIVTGGIGSIRGAFYGALVVGMIDMLGRVFLPNILRAILEPAFAQAAGPALASMLVYLVMGVVLLVRPEGLFPVKHG